MTADQPRPYDSMGFKDRREERRVVSETLDALITNTLITEEERSKIEKALILANSTIMNDKDWQLNNLRAHLLNLYELVHNETAAVDTAAVAAFSTQHKKSAESPGVSSFVGGLTLSDSASKLNDALNWTRVLVKNINDLVLKNDAERRSDKEADIKEWLYNKESTTDTLEEFERSFNRKYGEDGLKQTITLEFVRFTGADTLSRSEGPANVTALTNLKKLCERFGLEWKPAEVATTAVAEQGYYADVTRKNEFENGFSNVSMFLDEASIPRENQRAVWEEGVTQMLVRALDIDNLCMIAYDDTYGFSDHGDAYKARVTIKINDLLRHLGSIFTHTHDKPWDLNTDIFNTLKNRAIDRLLTNVPPIPDESYPLTMWKGTRREEEILYSPCLSDIRHLMPGRQKIVIEVLKSFKALSL